jgi:NitT/TauT family transport system permease protein
MEASTDQPDFSKKRPAAPRRSLAFNDLFRPHEPISRRSYVLAALLSVLVIFAIWCILTYGGIVKPAFFLPSPTQVFNAGVRMIQTGELLEDSVASVTVIIIGWVAAALAAIPFGIMMGSFKIVEALLEPIVDSVRYLPVSALIGLFILYFGLGIEEKVAVIFTGTFFQLILMIADVATHVPKDVLDSAYTLGASRWRVLTTVLVPATLPGVMDALRITLGWAWTYLIVAELVAADHGLGVMILESGRGLHTDRIFVGLVTIGFLGFISDFIFKQLHRRLLPWSPRIR